MSHLYNSNMSTSVSKFFSTDRSIFKPKNKGDKVLIRYPKLTDKECEVGLFM